MRKTLVVVAVTAFFMFSVMGCSNGEETVGEPVLDAERAAHGFFDALYDNLDGIEDYSDGDVEEMSFDMPTAELVDSSIVESQKVDEERALVHAEIEDGDGEEEYLVYVEKIDGSWVVIEVE